jgi:hypothetical protein
MKSGNADGGKRPQLRANARSNEDGGIDVSLATPASVQKLQMALHAKAKEAPDFRFYALYDKVYRKDVLAFAYECCKANGGAAGVDGQTFEDIEAYGKERWLDELAQELKKRTYQPLPVRRVYIPKPDGETAAVRGARYPRPGSGNGGGSRTRTYIRGRPAVGTVRLSARPQRTGRCKTRP